MGKILDAVRAKNGNTLSSENEQFVSRFEEALNDVLKEEVSASEKRNSDAFSQALKNVVGEFSAEQGKETQTIVSQLRSMAEKMDKLESLSQGKISQKERYNLRSKLEAHKDNILKAVRSGSPSAVEIAFDGMRAAALMTTQNVVTGAEISSGMDFEWDNEIAYIKYPKNFVLDIIRSRQVARVKEAKLKREQSSREGQAVITAEGAVKPLVSYTFEDKVYNRIKIAAHMEWTEEFENDFDTLFNSIIDLFETDLLRDWQNILLNKILATAPGYISTTLDGTINQPTIYSVIGAGILSIQNMLFEPNVIWMNQADVWAMNLATDNIGQPVMPPIMVGSNQIAGLSLKVSNGIAPGKILMGDSNTWKEEHTGFISRIGLINDQLIRNEKTIVGEVFSLMYQANRDAGSWIYLDIDAVKEALTIIQ
ncbi:MAG: hypothetical protein LBL79_05415 [Prevotella sp.]|jgi:hypothetical protein|nr:hypothetical protein [Prevotella sp.]